jgi:hypothetical protein
MSAIQFKPEPSSDRGEIHRSRAARSMGKSAGATLIELGITLAGGGSSPAIPGLCSRCRSGRNVQSSSAQYPSVFCSEQCEQEFIRTALASLTLEDCIRIHGRLEDLLMHAPEPAV